MLVQNVKHCILREPLMGLPGASGRYPQAAPATGYPNGSTPVLGYPDHRWSGSCDTRGLSYPVQGARCRQGITPGGSRVSSAATADSPILEAPALVTASAIQNGPTPAGTSPYPVLMCAAHPTGVGLLAYPRGATSPRQGQSPGRAAPPTACRHPGGTTLAATGTESRPGGAPRAS